MSLSRVEWLKIILLTILWKVPEKYTQKFLDVKSTDWFTEYVEYASKNWLLRDLKNNFYQNKNLSRIEVMYIIYKLWI